MKRYLLFFLFFAFLLRGYAQVSIQITPNNVSSAVNPDSFEVRGKATIRNTSNQTKKFTWVRNIVSISNGWQALVCDNKSCWSASVSSAPEQIELAPNGTSNMDVYIRPNNKSGNATVDIRVSEVGNDANNVTGRYVFSSSTSTKDPKSTNAIRIYPNPAVDFFMIVDDGDLVDKVVIYNIIGRQMRSYPVTAGSRYTINDLPDGMYIIRLQNASGSTVKTIRLNKARVKA
jgi:hypothetical protein